MFKLKLRVEEPNHSKLWWAFSLLLIAKSFLLAIIMFPYDVPTNLTIMQILPYVPLHILFIVFPMTFAFLFNGKQGYYFQFIVSVLLSILFFSDAIYFKAFGSPISIYTFFQFGNTAGLLDSFFELVEFIHLFFFIDLPFLLIYIYRNNIKESTNLKLFRYMSTILILPIIFYLIFYNLRALPSYAVIQSSSVGYHTFEIKDLLLSGNENLSSSQVETISKWLEQNNKYSHLISINNSTMKDKNLIVIQVESLETFTINNIVEEQRITPNLDELINSSFYFPNIFTQVGDGGSSDAEFMFNTSLYPLEKGSVFFRYPNYKYNSLPTILKNKGYDSIVLHGDEYVFWNRHLAFPSLGFDKYISEVDMEMDDIIGMGLSDESFFDQSMEYLLEYEQPIYSYLITLTSHVPFIIPDNESDLEFSAKINGELKRYYESINYVDRQIGHFINNLEKYEMLDNSLVVILGDHGGYNRYYEETDDPMDTRVPLIIYNPEIDGKTFNFYGGQIDIFPTIADLLGIPSEEYSESIMGKNLFNAEEGFAVLRNGEIIGSIENQEHHLQGPEIGDLLIRGNFFGEKLSGELEIE